MMSETVIKVENLSKRYRIGLEDKADTFAEQLKNTFLYPIKNIRKIAQMTRFDKEDDSIFWALRDINFEVKKGEVLGIVGHNGAGKSTLLKILSRITEPTSGKIEIRGRVSALLEVGTGFHPELTGRDNVYMNGTILGMRKKEIDAKFDEIVAFSGVEKHIDTPVKFYSSGMRVRLAFSVAAHLEPEILIIDEVLAVGDVEFQNKCLGKMEDVAGQGRTVLFVSHNMEAVERMCDQSLLLDSGNLKDIGTTYEILQKYENVRRQNFKLKHEWIEDEGLFELEGITLVSIELINDNHGIPRCIRVRMKYLREVGVVPMIQLFNSKRIKIMSSVCSVRHENHNDIVEYDLELPLESLIDGRYFINLSLVRNGNQRVLRFSELLNFEIYRPLKRMDYMEKNLPIVKLRDDWSINTNL
uniref:ABC transporter ATP-binding protein n=2 Tax=Marinoscillum pacificum TaxID=392723 RepID=UPI00358F490A